MIKKYIILLTLLVSSVVIAVGLLLYGDYKNMNKELSDDAKNILSLESQRLAFMLDDVRSDLSYLARKFSTHEKDDILDDILNFSIQKKRYDQIRYLDNSGMEIIRADFNNGNPYLVSNDRLQNKKSRYYFLDSISIAKNSIYISPLDLNIEQGQIEVPIKPMIRFATPVFDSENKRIGILVLNYFADLLLNKIKNSGKKFVGDVTLLNSDSYYLVGKNSADEWGFMFADKSEVTLKKRSPKVWDYINSGNFGHIEDERGVYYFKTIDLNDILSELNTLV